MKKKRKTDIDGAKQAKGESTLKIQINQESRLNGGKEWKIFDIKVLSRDFFFFLNIQVDLEKLNKNQS